MKNEVYFYDVSPLKNKDVFEACFLVASPQRKEKIENLKTEKDKILCLGVDVVLKKILAEDTKFCETDFKCDSLGKPFLQNEKGEKMCISVSHSGDFVMCAVSDKEIGVDIEKQRKVKLKTAEKFSENEKKYIFSAENPETAFFKVWTFKESYLKTVGIGIRQELDSFETTDFCGNPQMCNGYSFFEIEIPGYCVAVCSQYKRDDFEIKFLNSSDTFLT